jgi:hypothetical protein
MGLPPWIPDCLVSQIKLDNATPRQVIIDADVK